MAKKRANGEGNIRKPLGGALHRGLQLGDW